MFTYRPTPTLIRTSTCHCSIVETAYASQMLNVLEACYTLRIVRDLLL